jgi:hypothetical protein
VAYYGRDNCSTSQSAAAASIANVIDVILFVAVLGGGAGIGVGGACCRQRRIAVPGVWWGWDPLLCEGFFCCDRPRCISAMAKEYRDLLHTFLWGRFTSSSGGRAITANARQAMAFYPVHSCSAKGVSTSVGTALGFYGETAAARGNCKHDRNVMIFGVSGQEETLARRDDCALGGSYTWSWLWGGMSTEAEGGAEA